MSKNYEGLCLFYNIDGKLVDEALEDILKGIKEFTDYIKTREVENAV